MAKSLCKLKKKMLKKDPQAYMALVSDPRYLCVKCGRVANEKKRLCDGTKV